jgi:predicted metal-dependent hydrolase
MRWATLLRDLDQSEERRRLRKRIQRLLDKWQPILGVQIGDWDLREMKMYWGSSRRAGCDAFVCRDGHITFNTQLAQLPPRYLEYMVVHELVHQLTDGHDAKFYKLMDDNLPGWRRMQARIEEPLKRYS